MVKHRLSDKIPPHFNMFILSLGVGVTLIGASSRTPLSSLGPLLTSVQENLQLTNAVAGSLTAIPLLIFGVLAPLAPSLSDRFGLEKVTFFSLLVLTIGILTRVYPSLTLLFLGTSLFGIGIAICNVLIPAIIKQTFPTEDRIDDGGIWTFYEYLCRICLRY
ncbi:MFS transporter [Shouchella miscanthi]|uniref:MFS transporter n=1 Tax=Shouchella miscanthi TaxID=2598861 RepID=A0ABU6NM98_9BACI|nr:MFS transporter [Shouchella miscanthi]MED4128859.1 MFS transporter [Shouchella miscanthi]